MPEVPDSVNSDVTSKQNVKKKRRRNRKKTSGNEAETVVASEVNHNPTTTIEAKKKKKNKPKSKTTKDASSAKSHELQLPHVKVTLRNIVNVKEMEGSYTAGMVQLLREIVEERNKMVLDNSATDASLSGISIVFDESSIQKILIRAKKQREVENDKETNEEGSDDHVKEECPKGEEQTNELYDSDHVMDTDITKNCIQARLLYLIPPHKSRRRGIIPGHCYLVLSPPVPKFYQDKMQMKKQNPTTTVSDIASEVNALNIDDKDVSQPPKDESIQAPSEVDSMKQSNALSETDITPADRSKAFALARIVLNQAVESLSKVCKTNDTTKEKIYSSVQVFASQSQKIWKDDAAKGKKGSRMITKYENTIEKNEDFLKFIEGRKAMEEERLNRPKPQPGGGLSTSAVIESKGTGVSLDENGQPVSAIVLHLRQKHATQALAKSKLQAEKKKNRPRKIAKGGRATAVDSSSSIQASTGNVSKKKKRNKNKRKEKSEAQPSKLLKKPS